MNITVYLGSTPGKNPVFLEAAEEVGSLIGGTGNVMVYGGADGGLMGRAANAVLEAGGTVIGVIPEFFTFRGHQELSELHVVKNMSERKNKMIDLGDAFLALPGGPGTIEEISEIISAVRIGIFQRPCVIYNRNGYYDDLKNQYDRMVEEGFLTAEERSRFLFADTIEEVGKALGIL